MTALAALSPTAGELASHLSIHAERCRRAAQLSFGRMRIALGQPSESQVHLVAESALTGVAAAQNLPLVFQRFCVPFVKQITGGRIRALDVSSSAGLAALALARIGSPQVDLHSRSPWAREIFRRNVARNFGDAQGPRVLEALDPGRIYDLILVDAFETAEIADLLRLGRLLAPGGILVLFGFPGAYCQVLNSRLTVSSLGWFNEGWCAIFTPGDLQNVQAGTLPAEEETPGERAADEWENFGHRFWRWATTFRTVEVDGTWRLETWPHPAHVLPSGDAGGAGLGLVLLPSLMWGSGGNPLTQMMIRALLPSFGLCGSEASRLEVLDLGCGSGILGLAAKRAGAARVDAMDIDLEALRGASVNARLNGLEIRLMPAIDPSSRYHLIVANMFGLLHLKYLPVYGRILHEGGCILMAGFSEDQEAAIAAGFAEAGYSLVAEFTESGWSAWVFRASSGRLPG